MNILVEIQAAKKLIAQSRFQEADDMLENVIRDDPANVTALLLLSDVKKGLGQRLLAIECAKHTGSIAPENEIATEKLRSLREPGEIDWINTYFAHAGILDRGEISSILNFSLIWSIFEGVVCDKNASIPRMEVAVNRLKDNRRLRLSDFVIYLDYFKHRYITDNKINGRFDRLRFRSGDRKRAG